MVVKTFRALLADGGQNRIALSTIKGKVGYRIIKFDILLNATGVDQQSVVQVFTEEQTVTAPATIDFSDNSLLAAGVLIQEGSGGALNFTATTIFDQEIFNQDIYITHVENQGTKSLNYYLELEVIPLDDAGAEYTTLKDMRAE